MTFVLHSNTVKKPCAQQRLWKLLRSSKNSMKNASGAQTQKTYICTCYCSGISAQKQVICGSRRRGERWARNFISDFTLFLCVHITPPPCCDKYGRFHLVGKSFSNSTSCVSFRWRQLNVFVMHLQCFHHHFLQCALASNHWIYYRFNAGQIERTISSPRLIPRTLLDCQPFIVHISWVMDQSVMQNLLLKLRDNFSVVKCQQPPYWPSMALKIYA